jgi:hypothetical protein
VRRRTWRGRCCSTIPLRKTERRPASQQLLAFGISVECSQIATIVVASTGRSKNIYGHPENQCCNNVSFEVSRAQSIMNDAEHLTTGVNTLRSCDQLLLETRRYTKKDLTDDAQCTIYQAIANCHTQGVVERVAVKQVADFYHVNHSTAWFIWKPRRALNDLTIEDQCSIYQELANLQSQVGETAAVSQVAEYHHVYYSTALSIWKIWSAATAGKASGTGVIANEGLPPLSPPTWRDPNVAVPNAWVRHNIPAGGNSNPGVSASVNSRAKKSSTPKARQCVETTPRGDRQCSSQVDQYYSRHVFLTEQRGRGPYGSDLEVCYPDWSSDDDSDKENDRDL